VFLAPTLAKVGVAFGPAECFTLMLTSLMIVTYLVRGSMVMALIMVALGLVLGTLGNYPLTGKGSCRHFDDSIYQEENLCQGN